MRAGTARLGRYCWDHPLYASLRMVMVALWPVITFAIIPSLPRNDYLMTVSLDESTRTATLGLLLLAVITPAVIRGLSDLADRVIAAFSGSIDRAADRIIASSSGSVERMHADLRAELREDAAQQSDAALAAIRQDLAAVSAQVIAAATADGTGEPAVSPGAARRLRLATDDDNP
jgi:hypothetical protein